MFNKAKLVVTILILGLHVFNGTLAIKTCLFISNFFSHFDNCHDHTENIVMISIEGHRFEPMGHWLVEIRMTLH